MRILKILYLLTLIPFDCFALSTGTAFAVSDDGFLLTNHHVIADAKTIVVRDQDNQYYIAEVQKSDEILDLAILRIKVATPSFLVASKQEDVKKGEKIYAIGFPHIDIQGGESKVTEGIINSLTGLRNDTGLYQISAEIQSGNSGGPLIKSDGSVVGVVASKLSAAKILKTTGDMTQNVNYAIKIEEVERLYPSLIKYKVRGKKVKSPDNIIEKTDKAVYLVIASEQRPRKTNLQGGVIRPYIISHNQNSTSKPTPSLDPQKKKDVDIEKENVDVEQLTEAGINAYSKADYKTALNNLKKAADSNYPYAQYFLALYYLDGKVEKVNYNSSAYWMEKAANNNIADAQSLIGLFYKNGDGVTKDLSKAIYYLSLAANQSHTLAQYNLGGIYFTGNGVQKDMQKAKDLFTKASKQKHVRSKYYLAVIASQEQGFANISEETFNLYKDVAERGESLAYPDLGRLYFYGYGTKKDVTKAIQWLKKATESSEGAPDSEYLLGLVYSDNEGTEKNDNEAIKWFLKSASHGYSIAQEQLGWVYRNGTMGLKQDHKAAYDWFLKAANQNLGAAQVSVGWYLYNGVGGIEKDIKKYIDWNLKASELGEDIAQYNLWNAYFQGIGVTKNEEKAILWLKKSAEKGNFYAQNDYGVVLFNGIGVKKDRDAGRKFIKKAADQNDNYAIKNLKELETKAGSTNDPLLILHLFQ